jgi:hypothetical protein
MHSYGQPTLQLISVPGVTNTSSLSQTPTIRLRPLPLRRHPPGSRLLYRFRGIKHCTVRRHHGSMLHCIRQPRRHKKTYKGLNLEGAPSPLHFWICKLGSASCPAMQHNGLHYCGQWLWYLGGLQQWKLHSHRRGTTSVRVSSHNQSFWQ